MNGSRARRAFALVEHVFVLLALCAPRRATACNAGSYSYGSGACAACPAGVAAFVASTGLCAPVAAPADTAFFLSGTQAEGVAAFPSAPSVSYTTSVFGAASGALSFASGASFLAVTPAAGSALLAALPTGDAPFTASAWLKCAAGGFMAVMSWGAPAASGASAQTSVTLAAGPASGAGSAGAVIMLAAGFNLPFGVAVDAAGNVIIADSGNNAVKKISPDGTVSTLASGFNFPCGVAVDAAGNVIVADTSNGAIKKISLPGGEVSTLASGFSGPSGVAVDAAGNLIVADTYNGAIKKILLPGGEVITLASGFSGPSGVAVDAAGDVIVADTNNNAVKKISLPGGEVSTLALVHYPCGVAVDAAGNVIVADTSPNGAIKKISLPGGEVSTLASGGLSLWGVAVDAAGNVIIADMIKNAVYVVVQTAFTCDSAWHHLAVTHGGNSPSATQTYLGGVLIATSSKTFAVPTDGSAALFINSVLSANSNGGMGNSAGAVSDVRLYSRALSAAEVLALSQPPLAAYPNTAVAPAAPVLGATSYTFSCAAGSAGVGASIFRNLDRSWSWAAGGAVPSCALCLAGSFAASSGSAACTPCSPGTYSSTTGASSCSPCDAGRYGSSAGLTTSACSGACSPPSACAPGTAYPPPITGLSCASSGARAAPSSLGLLLWPAAHPQNPQPHVDLIIAPLAACQQLTSAAACASAASVAGADGVLRYVVGTAAALHLEAAEAIACSAQ